ncbi:MAG TPA: YceI family protein [Vicinamibacterales bacterium]|nr:YceI family protein [Vicinamibacterales bacterium]
MRKTLAFAIVLVSLMPVMSQAEQQGPPPAGGRGPMPQMGPAPDPTKPAKLDIGAGTVARYKVREQLAGISFPSDAVGTTQAVTGTIVVNPDGTIDAAKSKITVDLTTIQSDQQMRDGYVRNNTLETQKYPSLEFVPKRAVGLPSPLPSGMGAQAGFQLIGDMTVHGVTSEVTWTVVATFTNDAVAGRATSTFPFATFKMTKPSLARLLSVDDKIELEIEFKCKRTTA